VNRRSAEYHQIPDDHPIRSGAVVDAAWDSHLVFVHPDDHENTRRVWANCLKTGRGGEVEFRTQGADGIYRWFLSRAEPLRAEDGTILLWVGLNLEIDDRKRTESELRQMLDFTPQLVCVHGASGEQIHINRIALAYFGMTLEEWQKSRLSDKVHPDDAERVVRGVLRGGDANGVAGGGVGLEVVQCGVLAKLAVAELITEGCAGRGR